VYFDAGEVDLGGAVFDVEALDQDTCTVHSGTALQQSDVACRRSIRHTARK
jgi:hypothetical protein